MVVSGHVFHRYGLVRKTLGRDLGARGDQAAAHHVFRGGVDGLYAATITPSSQVEDGEASGRPDRRAARAGRAGAVQARDLELQVVLVGPEPGDLVVGLRLAADR